MTTFATGRVPNSSVALHIAHCPTCLHRAAIAWSMLNEEPDPRISIPQPNLDFLNAA